jgi:hypothetical protein
MTYFKHVEHDLEEVFEDLPLAKRARRIGYRCRVCYEDWKSKPQSSCVGVRKYKAGEEIPANLIGRHQMFERGLDLAPEQQIKAYYGYALYDEAECVPLPHKPEFTNGKYALCETDDGFVVYRKGGEKVIARYADTWILVRKGGGKHETQVGIYQQRYLLYVVADKFVDQLLNDPDEEAEEQARDMISKALGRRIFEQWQRIVKNIVPPDVEKLARLMFASARGDADLLHMPELYTDDYKFVYGDLVKYHAARLYAKHLCADAHLLNEPTRTEKNREALEKLRNWRKALTPAVPTKALHKTLDKFPRGVPYGHLARLSTMKLEQPLISRLQVLFALCAGAHENWGLHESIVLAATDEQIKAAGDLFGMPVKATSKVKAIDGLASRILDYPEVFHGDLLGLARRSHEWHATFRNTSAPRSKLPDATPLPVPSIDLHALQEKGITFLSTAGAVHREGQKMDHCVGTYATKAYKGRCYLFHVDYSPGEDKPTYSATIEVLSDGAIAQAYGPAHETNPACFYGVQMLAAAFAVLAKGGAA